MYLIINIEINRQIYVQNKYLQCSTQETNVGYLVMGARSESLGQSILVVLCAGFTLLLTLVVRPTTSQPATPS